MRQWSFLPQRNAPPTVSVKQQQQRQRQGGNQNKQYKQPGPLQGAGVGPFHAPKGEDKNASDLTRALQLWQSVVSAEDFSKYETVLTPPKARWTQRREEALLEEVQTQEHLEKQEMGHCEQISKLEDNLMRLQR